MWGAAISVTLCREGATLKVNSRYKISRASLTMKLLISEIYTGVQHSQPITRMRMTFIKTQRKWKSLSLSLVALLLAHPSSLLRTCLLRLPASVSSASASLAALWRVLISAQTACEIFLRAPYRTLPFHFKQISAAHSSRRRSQNFFLSFCLSLSISLAFFHGLYSQPNTA